MDGKTLVQLGTAIGIIAAQTVGEPGTQLTLQTFHSGGAATEPNSNDDDDDDDHDDDHDHDHDHDHDGDDNSKPEWYLTETPESFRDIETSKKRGLENTEGPQKTKVLERPLDNTSEDARAEGPRKVLNFSTAKRERGVCPRPIALRRRVADPLKQRREKTEKTVRIPFLRYPALRRAFSTSTSRGDRRPWELRKSDLLKVKGVGLRTTTGFAAWARRTEKTVRTPFLRYRALRRAFSTSTSRGDRRPWELRKSDLLGVKGIGLGTTTGFAAWAKRTEKTVWAPFCRYRAFSTSASRGFRRPWELRKSDLLGVKGIGLRTTTGFAAWARDKYLTALPWDNFPKGFKWPSLPQRCRELVDGLGVSNRKELVHLSEGNLLGKEGVGVGALERISSWLKDEFSVTLRREMPSSGGRGPSARVIQPQVVEQPNWLIRSPITGTMRFLVPTARRMKLKPVRTMYGESGYILQDDVELIIHNRGARYRTSALKGMIILVSSSALESADRTDGIVTQRVKEYQIVARFPEHFSAREQADSCRHTDFGPFDSHNAKCITAHFDGEVFFQGVLRAGGLRSRGKVWNLSSENMSFPKTSEVLLEAGQYVRAGDRIAVTPISNEHSGTVRGGKGKGEVTVVQSVFIEGFSVLRDYGCDWLMRNCRDCGVSFPLLADRNSIISPKTLFGRATLKRPCGGGRIFLCDKAESTNSEGKGARSPSVYWLPEETHNFTAWVDVKVDEGSTVRKGEIIGYRKVSTKRKGKRTAVLAGIDGVVFLDPLRRSVSVKSGFVCHFIQGRCLPPLERKNRFVRRGDRVFSRHVVEEDLMYLDFCRVEGGYVILMRPTTVFRDLAAQDVATFSGDSGNYLLWEVSRLYRNGESTSSPSTGGMRELFHFRLGAGVHPDSPRVKFEGIHTKGLLHFSVTEEISLVRKNSLPRRTSTYGRRILPKTVVGVADTFSRVSGVVVNISRGELETVVKIVRDESIRTFSYDPEKKSPSYSASGHPLVKEGDLVKSGTRLTPSLFSSCCGQVLRVKGGVIAVRLARPLFLSPEALLYVGNGALVWRGDILGLEIPDAQGLGSGSELASHQMDTSRDPLTESRFIQKKQRRRRTNRKKRKLSFVLEDDASLRKAGGTAILSGGGITDGVGEASDVLEIRKVAGAAMLAPVSGRVKVRHRIVEIATPSGKVVEVDRRSGLLVHTGDYIPAGSAMTVGPIDLNEKVSVLFNFYTKWCGYSTDRSCDSCLIEARLEIIDRVVDVYQRQGLKFWDRYFELLVWKLACRVRVVSSGDTSLTPGEILLFSKAKRLSKIARVTEQVPPNYEPLLTGLTSTGLKCEGFLSAASFQDTVRVLVEASVEGRRDWLSGIKENVIISRLLPLGYAYYQSFNPSNIPPAKIVGKVNTKDACSWVLKLRLGGWSKLFREDSQGKVQG
jgi:hypothetical protein